MPEWLPTINGWHDQYSSSGLVIMGNHLPEFSCEANLESLSQPVLADRVPDDKRGHICYIQIDEGAYIETEAATNSLLVELNPDG